MGIQVEFNPDLCLRAFGAENREPTECVPESLTRGLVFHFLKEGQRCFWFDGPVPLRITTGGGNYGEPVAMLKIVSATHRKMGDRVWTEGLAMVV